MSWANFVSSSGKLLVGSESISNETVNSNLAITNGTQTINHSVGSSGTYSITGSTGATLLAFDGTDTLIDCVLSEQIAVNSGEIQYLIGINVTGTINQNTVTSIANVPVSNNNNGMIWGNIVTDLTSLNFKVFCKNVSNVLTIINWTTDGFISGSDTFNFSVSGSNINVSFDNSTVTSSYSLRYWTNFKSY
jgi:hypothetical protein